MLGQRVRASPPTGKNRTVRKIINRFRGKAQKPRKQPAQGSWYAKQQRKGRPGDALGRLLRIDADAKLPIVRESEFGTEYGNFTTRIG